VRRICLMGCWLAPTRTRRWLSKMKKKMPGAVG
jgi:hypothetical protein